MIPHIFIKLGRSYTRIKLDDLVYIREIQDRVNIHLIKGRQCTAKLSLENIAAKLPPGLFYKISSDCIVSSKHIISFDCESITLTGCKTFAVEEEHQGILAFVTNLLVTPLLQ